MVALLCIAAVNVLCCPSNVQRRQNTSKIYMFVAAGSSNGVEPMQRRGSGAAPGGGAAAAGAEQDDAEDLEALDRKQQAVRAARRNA